MSKDQRPYKYPLVLIIWDDAESDDGWEEAPKELKPALATTVGFLIRKTKNHILVAHSYDNGHTNGRIQIPQAMIKSIKEIS